MSNSNGSIWIDTCTCLAHTYAVAKALTNNIYDEAQLSIPHQHEQNNDTIDKYEGYA